MSTKYETFVDDDKVYQYVEEDESPLIDQNHAERAAQPETMQYKGKTLAKAASVSAVMIEKMRNGQCCPDGTSYNLLSGDTEEKRRALVHLQTYHPEYLTVKGRRPFAMKRVI